MAHPPVLMVFNRVSDRNPNRTISRVQELTRHLSQGERQHGGHHHYDGRIPIIATGPRNLREHGPTGPVFYRFGRDRPQPLLDAIGNPRRNAADARALKEARARQQEYQAHVRRAAEREARRPSCAARFTDERWEEAQLKDWVTPKDSHPELCDVRKDRSVNAAQKDQAVQEQDLGQARVAGGGEEAGTGP